MRKEKLLGPKIWTQCQDSFWSYVDSLYQRSSTSKESKAVRGVSVFFGKRTIVRVNKSKQNTLTNKEIELLSMEHEKSYNEMLEVFTSRKFTIKDHLTQDVIYEHRPKRRNKVTPEGNAFDVSTTGQPT